MTTPATAAATLAASMAGTDAIAKGMAEPPGKVIQKEGGDKNGGFGEMKKGDDGGDLVSPGAAGNFEKGEFGEKDPDKEEDDDKDGDPMEKSLAAFFASKTPAMQKSLDVAPVLGAMVEGFDEVASGLHERLVKGFGEQGTVTELLMRGMASLLDLNKGMATRLDHLTAEVTRLGGTPNPRKAATPAVLAKSMAGTTEGAASGTLTAAQIQNRLHKGIQQGIIHKSMAYHLDMGVHTIPADVMAKIAGIQD